MWSKWKPCEYFPDARYVPHNNTDANLFISWPSPWQPPVWLRIAGGWHAAQTVKPSVK